MTYALTSCIKRYYRKLSLVPVKEQVAVYINPCQFAYRRNRLLYMYLKVHSHLEKPGISIRLMLYDFFLELLIPCIPIYLLVY